MTNKQALLMAKKPSEPMLKVTVDDKVMNVPRSAYVKAKTKQLREFGYNGLDEATVNAQIDAVLAGKEFGDGLTVIGGFMKDELLNK